jgi:hypothetical protein
MQTGSGLLPIPRTTAACFSAAPALVMVVFITALVTGSRWDRAHAEAETTGRLLATR